jgi:hypothetical protein
MLATISLPSAPPIERMIVFIPVATPVWALGTASTMRFGIAANEKPIPAPMIALPR